MVKFLSAESCSVYLIQENRLVKTAVRDTKEVFNRQEELPLVSKSMVSEAINARQTISLNALRPLRQTLHGWPRTALSSVYRC